MKAGTSYHLPSINSGRGCRISSLILCATYSLLIWPILGDLNLTPPRRLALRLYSVPPTPLGCTRETLIPQASNSLRSPSVNPSRAYLVLAYTVIGGVAIRLA